MVAILILQFSYSYDQKCFVPLYQKNYLSTRSEAFPEKIGLCSRRLRKM